MMMINCTLLWALPELQLYPFGGTVGKRRQHEQHGRDRGDDGSRHFTFHDCGIGLRKPGRALELAW